MKNDELVETTLDTCKKLVDNKMKDQVQKTYDILEISCFHDIKRITRRNR